MNTIQGSWFIILWHPTQQRAYTNVSRKINVDVTRNDHLGNLEEESWEITQCSKNLSEKRPKNTNHDFPSQ